VDDSHGRSFLPRTRKSRAVLAALAIASPKPVLRVNLASLLWSRREKEQARASLRQSVHELQDVLGPAWDRLLVADRHNLSLRGEGLEVDALALAQPQQVTAELLDSFENVLLEDLSGLDPAFDRWLEEERARFARIGRALGDSVLSKCADAQEAFDVAERLLGLDRGHEGAWRAVIRGHAERGDMASALAAYEQCRATLAEASSARPSAETEELAERLRGQQGRLQKEWSDPSPRAVPYGEPGGAVRPAGQAWMAEPPPELLGAPRYGARRDRATVRLSISALRTLGGDPGDGLAVGLAEEILAGLSRFRWISCVMAPEGAAPRPGSEPDLVLEGTVQYSGARVRIIVRLMDCRADGETVWAGRFDRVLSDALTLQDELGAAIVAQVDPELMRHEGSRSQGARQDEATAQGLLLQALPSIYRLERDSFEGARRLLEASLRVDPASSVAHGWLAYWDLLYVGQGWATDPAAVSTEAARLAERAVMMDPGDARALTLAGHVRGFLAKRPEEAAALHERAIALNPNLALAWCFSGLTQSYLGRHDEALRRMNQAIRLSPSDPHVFMFDTALIMPHLMRGDYASAIEVGRRAAEINPLFSSAYKGYLSALGMIDRPREAGEVLEKLLRLEPGFTVEEAVLRSPLSRPEDIARYAEGLRRAGLREAAFATAPARPALLIEHARTDLMPLAQRSPARYAG
jgi:tetratricopeptide (TPR) repeat protein